MRNQKQIEDRCAAMAKAIAQLIDAVVGVGETTNQEKHDCAESPPSSLALGASGTNAGRRIYVYLAGSRGCANLARTYGTQIMAALGLSSTPYVVKCGTTTNGLDARLRQIGQDGYGAAVRTQSGVSIEPGFTAWVAHTIVTSRQPRDPAITLMPRAIAIDLPSGLTRRAFDTALRRALQRRALTSVPGKEIPRRYVAYQLVETRISAACEFYAMSPHQAATGDLILDAVEGILGRARAKRT